MKEKIVTLNAEFMLPDCFAVERREANGDVHIIEFRRKDEDYFSVKRDGYQCCDEPERFAIEQYFLAVQATKFLQYRYVTSLYSGETTVTENSYERRFGRGE